MPLFDPQLAYTWRAAEYFGARGDGVTDDAAALQRGLDSGFMVYLDPRKQYAFGTQLLYNLDNCGIVGMGRMLMLTGAGKFDASAYGGGFAANKVGIYANAKVNPILQAIIEMEANAGIRVCNPIAIRDCTDAQVEAKIKGFKEAEFALLTWDSNKQGHVRVWGRDCTADTDTLPSMQLTLFGIDYNRTVNGNSQGCDFVASGYNIQLGATAIAQYGYQSDCVNIQAIGYTGHNGKVISNQIDEPLDCFGSGNTIEVVAKDCFYGVKLVHGAQYNNIKAAINRTRDHAVVFSGSSVSDGQPVSANYVNAVCTQVGELAGGSANKSGVAFDGSSATYTPSNNRADIIATSNGSMKYVAYFETGENNVVEVDGGTTSGGIIGYIDSGAVAGKNLIRRKQGTHIRVSWNASTATRNSLLPYDNILADTLAEYDPVTYTFTVKCAGRYRVRAQIRYTSVGAGQNLGLAIQKNGAAIARETPYNYDLVNAKEIWASTETVVDCVSGDTINVMCLGSTGTTFTVTGNAEFTFFEIDQI